MTHRFRMEPLTRSHDRDSFSCGHARIDAYFRDGVSQGTKRNYARCFVAIDEATDRVAGFYTLSSSSVRLTDVPDDLSRKLPRYPLVPAILIGWLGRHVDFAGLGLGEALLVDAIKTVATAPIGAHAIFAEAIDGKAASFYLAFGFIALRDRPQTLFLPMATASALVQSP